MYLGGQSGDVGLKIKETGTAHWQSPNTGATNSTGFTAIPGGMRHNSGSYNGINTTCEWWSNLYMAPDGGMHWYITHNGRDLTCVDVYATYGLSVRCVKD
jgi:uncharacterized protein (TIGR02145 family)